MKKVNYNEFIMYSRVFIYETGAKENIYIHQAGKKKRKVGVKNPGTARRPLKFNKSETLPLSKLVCSKIHPLPSASTYTERFTVTVPVGSCVHLI